MKQAENTINQGDAFKDALTRSLKKLPLSDVEWLGAVESDRSEQGYDLRMKRETFKKLFGTDCKPCLPRVRFCYGWSSMSYLKGGADFDARVNHAATGFDFLVHIRPTNDGRYVALVVPSASAVSFLSKFGREKYSAKNGWFIQLDGYALSTTGKPCQKWNDFMIQNGGFIADMTDYGFMAEDLKDNVNATGRAQATTDTSNTYNAKRKVGESYYGRPAL